MASNLIVARGGVEYVPPISLAFWRWTVVVLLLLPFTYSLLIKNSKIIKKEFKKLFFLGAMGCGVCGAFPFLAGEYGNYLYLFTYIYYYDFSNFF
jgi:drug/metabolite transporter (DMT)-like permease